MPGRGDIAQIQDDVARLTSRVTANEQKLHSLFHQSGVGVSRSCSDQRS